MTVSAEPSDTAPRWRWLDRWFEVRWRALLTWIGWMGLVGLVLEHGLGDMVEKMVDVVFNGLNGVLPTPLPAAFKEMAMISNFYIAIFWIEPLALRLNPVRALAWLAVRSSPDVVMFFFVHHDYESMYPYMMMMSAGLMVLVLSGRRTCPYIALLGGLLSVFVYNCSLETSLRFIGWLWPAAGSLPYAVTLLYCTRRVMR